MSNCRSCPAPIMWRETSKGRRIPLDPDPSPRGNVKVLDDVRCVTLGGQELEEARARGELLHISHFATCPNARRHRKVLS